MSCKVDIKDGQIVNVLADNGNDSKLFKDISSVIVDRGEALIEYQKVLAAGGTQLDDNNEPMYQIASSDLRGHNNELDSKLKKIVGEFGISVEELETSKYKNYDATGIADIATRAIYLSHNRAIDTLPEEVAHFYVKMLQYSGSPLYTSMMQDISKFQIYQEVVKEYSDIYNNDPTLLRQEAIGKAIARYVVANYTATPITLREANRTRTWFDRVLNWFKAKMSELGFTEPVKLENHFDIAAVNILNGKLRSEFNGNEVFQRAKASRVNPLLNAKLLANNELIRTEGSQKQYYNGSEWVAIKRVSDVVKEKGFGYFGKRTPEQQLIDTAKAEFGTKTHADLSELVKEETGQQPTLDTLGESGYKKNLRKIVRELMEQHKGGTFYTEINIFKPAKGNKQALAGTIDLLVIDKDGVAHIYDWKTISELLQKDTLNTKQYKGKWFEQLNQYKQILSEGYGITEFGEARIIPIDVRFNGKMEATSLVFGSNNGKVNTVQLGSDSLLTPVPLLSENTNNPIINNYLNNLRDKLANVKSSKVFNKQDLIQELQNAIGKVLVSKDITDADEITARDLVFYNKVLDKIDSNEALTEDEISNINDIRDFYLEAKEKGFVKTGDGSYIEELSDLIADTTLAVDEAIEQVLNSAHNVSQNDIIRGTSKWDVVNQLSDYDIPVFQAFRNLLQRAWNATEVKLRVKKDELLSIKKQIEEETGLSGIEMFDDIIAFDKDGNRTRNLIAKKNGAKWYPFYKANVKAIYKLSDYENPLALDSYFKNLKKTELGKLITDFPVFEAELRKRVSAFEDSRITYDADTGKRFLFKQISNLLGQDSTRFTIPVEYLSDKYKKIVYDKPDSGLAKLYNIYIDTNRLAAAECDSNIRGTTLPFIKKNIISAMVNAPFDTRSRAGMFSKFRVDEWTSFKTDSNGNRIYHIPLKYDVNPRNSDEQSYDLIEVLALWQETVLSNIELQKIENSTKVLKYALKKNKAYVINNGKIVKNGGEIATTELKNSPTIEQFNDYVNKYVYGINMKDDNETIFGYSRNKVAKAIIQYFSATTLFGSLFSGVANITGGIANIFGVAIRSNVFDYTDILAASQSFVNPASEHFGTTHYLKELFSIHTNTYENPKNKELSVEWLSKNLTFDKVFFVQKAGDVIVQQMTMGAYLRKIKLVKNPNGTIQFVKTNDTNDNIYSQVKEDSDGKYSIDGLDLSNEQHHLEFFKLREKIRLNISEILGTASEYDQFLAGNDLKTAALMQFRRWILPMYNSRYGRLKYNASSETYRQGKYISTFSLLMNRKIGRVTADLVHLSDGKAIDEVLYKKWEEKNELYPDLTYEEYKNNHMRDLRSTVADIAILGAMMLLRAYLDDDDKNPIKKVVVRGLTRSISELSFWFNPASFTSIIRSPIPILGMFITTGDLIKNYSEYFYYLLADEDKEAEKKLKKGNEDAARLTIGLSTWQSFKKELEDGK